MITWKTNNSEYVNGEVGWLNNKFKIFEIYWDSGKPKSEEILPYKLICHLPGLKTNLGNFELDDAKQKAFNALAYWLEKTGLKCKDDM